MKAAIRIKYCAPNKIKVETLNQPLPKKNEVLVKIHAATVNRTDCANLTAKPFIMRFVLGFFKPKKIILGTDFAGEIISKCKNIKSFNVGDRVFGFFDLGLESHAEYAIIKEKHLFKIPEKIGFKQAAASLEGAHYAYSFLHKVKFQPKQKILIIGATGAIGNALLQFAKQFDVHITATCNTKNIELIKNLGAHIVYDYLKEDFKDKNDTYDFIFDAVGKSTYGHCKPLLCINGIYVSSEFGPYSQNIFYSLISPVLNCKLP